MIKKMTNDMAGKRRGLRSAPILIAVLAVVMVLFTVSACSPPMRGKGSAGGQRDEACHSTLNPSDFQSLMKQVAKSEGQILYAESGLPDRDFATAEVFGVRKSGGKGTAYTRLEVWEYVALKGKAYSMSGIGGEAIIRFGYTDQGPRLTGVEWAADGDLHDKWVKRNFPRECQVKRDIFDSAFINGQGRLWRKLTKEVEKGMGVPVEEKNLLRIDEKKGTYQIVKEVRERKPLGRSRFVTIDKGRLSDVKRKR